MVSSRRGYLDTKVPLSFRLGKTENAALKILARAENTNVSELLRQQLQPLFRRAVGHARKSGLRTD